MKLHPARRSRLVVGALVGCTLVGTTALGAAPASAATVPCSAEELRSGACATFVTTSESDPLTEATRALVLQGNRAQAEELLTTVDASAAQIAKARAVLTDPEPAPSGEVDSGTAPGRVVPRGIYVNDWQWELNDTASYGYCGSNGCQVIGTANIGVWHDLHWYGDTGPGLAGSFQVKSGPAVQFTTLTCKTFYEVFPFDQKLKDWNNCSAAGYAGYTRVRQIDWADWKQGSAVGTQYHLEVTIKFNVQGGGSFTGLWNSNSYRIVSRTSAKFLH